MIGASATLRPVKRISGLKLWRKIGDTTFIVTKAQDVAIVVDVVLESTDPRLNEATIDVSVGGDREDLPRFLLAPGRRLVRVGGTLAVDIGAGIRIGIGRHGSDQGVTSMGAHLVIDAARDVWEIEREEVFAARLIAARKAGQIHWPTSGLAD